LKESKGGGERRGKGKKGEGKGGKKKKVKEKEGKGGKPLPIYISSYATDGR